MRRKPSILSAFLLIGLLLLPGFAPILEAQTAPPQPTPQQLDQLLAPIALYPDALLAQITTASTNPQEILDVTNWLAQNPSLTGPALTDAAQKQGYDPAFLALVTFPNVLQMMADNIDDYAAIGLAVTADSAGVASSIQRLRAQAYASGALRSNQQQKVEVQQVSNQPIYVIQPANPQVVYVPQYNPTVVYVAPSPGAVVATSLITFGIGIGIGALVYSNQPWGWSGWGWGWGHGGIYYNRGPWGGVWVGGYRPPSIWYHPRPPYYAHYPGYGGNWGYRPPNYRPPYPSQRPVYRPPGHYPGNPGYRPPVNNPGYRPPANGNRPPSTQPVRPGYPNNRPPGTTPPNGTRPSPGQPSIQPVRPAPGRPSTQPTRPTPTPRPSPQTRPAPQPRPANQSRPVPQARPTNSGGNRGGQGKPGGGGPQPR